MKEQLDLKKPLRVAVYARVGNAPAECEPIRVYSDKHHLLIAGRTGQIDHLLVESFTRLGRNTVEALGLLRELTGAGVRVSLLKEGRVV
ncbi:MAG: recombinase family protein [Clostridiales bacterium]|nr:recombinase family protein [Clostridiales bacterium]